MRTLFLVLALCLICAARVSAQVSLYVASGSGNASNLHLVNPTNATSTLIGPILAGASALTITGLAMHPISGILYGVTGNETGPSRKLVTINPTNGQAVIIGSLGTGSSDISFAADGTLYSWVTRGGPLATINLSTGVQTAIGSAANGTQSNGLTFTPNGTLYLAGPNAPGDLYTVNVTSGVITSAVTLSNAPAGLGPFNALASDPSGMLFGLGRSFGNQLVSINTVTGVITTIGVLAFEADAIAFSAIPEPETWLLLSLGLGFGLLRRLSDRAAAARRS